MEVVNGGGGTIGVAVGVGVYVGPDGSVAVGIGVSVFVLQFGALGPMLCASCTLCNEEGEQPPPFLVGVSVGIKVPAVLVNVGNGVTVFVSVGVGVNDGVKVGVCVGVKV